MCVMLQLCLVAASARAGLWFCASFQRLCVRREGVRLQRELRRRAEPQHVVTAVNRRPQHELVLIQGGDSCADDGSAQVWDVCTNNDGLLQQGMRLLAPTQDAVALHGWRSLCQHCKSQVMHRAPTLHEGNMLLATHLGSWRSKQRWRPA